MIGAYIGLIAFLAIPLMCACALVDGFRKGGMRARGARYYRADDPIWFWTLTSIYSLVATVYLGLLAYMVMGDLLAR